MKVNLLSISNDELVSNDKNNSIAFITSNLYKNSFDVVSDCISISNYENVLLNLENSMKSAEITLCICENEIDTAFLVKKAICSLVGEEMITNTYAKNNIVNYYAKNNLPVQKENLSYANMPNGARCITNLLGSFQGFLFTKGQNTIILMPMQPEELKNMFNVSVLPYLLERLIAPNKTYVFRTFGLKKSELSSILKEQIKNKNKIQIICNEKMLDAEIIISYPTSVKQDIIDNFISIVCNKLSAYMYAEEDTTMYSRAFDLLKINGLTLSVAEDITAGNFTANFYKYNENANQILLESYVTPNNNSKSKILGVDSDLFKNTEIDFEEVAYEMALGALENSGSEFVVSVTGDIEKGLCFIGIGNTKGIHVFKENIFGTLSEKIEKITNYTFFHLIKKLKQNDFHLLKTNV